MERDSAKRARYSNIQKYILAGVSTGAILSVALVAPNVIGALGKLGILPSKRRGEIIKRSFYRLKERGLIEFELGHIALTQKGKAELLKIQFGNLAQTKPKKWDAKWRILLFDIPEKNKKIRDRLRGALQTAGFYRLQDSAWLYPYDCEDFIALLKAELKPGSNVLYIIADTVENDKYLRIHFGLKTNR